jgi:hypothetical protein
MNKVIVSTGVMVGIVTLAMLVVAGCERSGSSSAAASGDSSQQADSLPASLIAATQPSDEAISVAAAKQSAKQGDHVLVRGRIGAQKEPLAKNRAILTLADVSLPTCDKTAMHTCETPWDSCCEPAEELVAKSATIQVVGADGRPLKAGLQGVAGIAPGKELVVAGTVTDLHGGDALVIAADRIYVMP